MEKINSSYKENFVIALQSLNQKIQISLPEYTFYPQIEERHRSAYGRFYVSKSADHYLTIEDTVTVGNSVKIFVSVFCNIVLIS